MSLSTTMLIILLGINLALFLFGSNTDVNNGVCVYCSPLFASASALITGNWAQVLISLGSGSWVYISLMLLVAAAAWLTGGVSLTGGGYGSILTLQILGIGLFVSLAGMPNFGAMGLPPTLTIVLDVIFGGMIMATMIGMFRGTD